MLVSVQWWKRLLVLGFWAGAVLGQVLGTPSTGSFHPLQLEQTERRVPRVSSGHAAPRGDVGTLAGGARAAPRGVSCAGRTHLVFGLERAGRGVQISLPGLQRAVFWACLGREYGARQCVFTARVAVLVQVSPSDPHGSSSHRNIASLPLSFRDRQMCLCCSSAHPFCSCARSVSHSVRVSALKSGGSSYSKCRLDEKEFFSGKGQMGAQEEYGDNVNQHERLVSAQLQP